MATKAENLRDQESCLNRAKPDEPIFVLRASDPLAADAVRRWAHARGLRRGGYDATYSEALKVADAMDEWREKHHG